MEMFFADCLSRCTKDLQQLWATVPQWLQDSLKKKFHTSHKS